MFHSSINVSVELEVDEPNHRHVADQAVDENFGLKREQNELLKARQVQHNRFFILRLFKN